MKTENNLATFLRTQGYSDRAIEEICKWYLTSTTKSSSGKLQLGIKN